MQEINGIILVNARYEETRARSRVGRRQPNLVVFRDHCDIDAQSVARVTKGWLVERAVHMVSNSQRNGWRRVRQMRQCVNVSIVKCTNAQIEL